MSLDFRADALRASPFVCEGLTLQPLDPRADLAVMQAWFVGERGRFWGLQQAGEAEVRQHYLRLQASAQAMAFAGRLDGSPAFLIECYDPARDELARHYPVQAGDVGLHLLIAPVSLRVSGHTRRVFRTALHFLFESLGAQRVVVEPDIRNPRIHALNRDMGFHYRGVIPLQSKLAALAFCTRAGFHASRSGRALSPHAQGTAASPTAPGTHSTLPDTPDESKLES